MMSGSLPVLRTTCRVEDRPDFAKELENSPLTLSSKYSRMLAANELISHKGQDSLTSVLGKEA